MGQWSWQTTCSDASDQGLHQKSGSFMDSKPQQKTRFDTHGPVQVSHDGRYLVHADDTPFFFLADTAWNGALHSTKEDWSHYIQERARQKFTAVQWVTTQW